MFELCFTRAPLSFSSPSSQPNKNPLLFLSQANADPHVGSAYTTIAADALARYARTCEAPTP